MEPEIPLEVWLADIPWGESSYPRPVVFLGHRSPYRLVVLRISSQLDLQAPGDFVISKSDPDFVHAGLEETSYVRGPMYELQLTDFIKRKGTLAGRLRERFEEWLQAGV